MKCLITGMGGAIGVHVMAHLLTNTDWEIVGIDSFRHKGEFDRITRFCRNHPDWPARVQVITHDLVAPFTPREVQALGEVDYILNLASLSDVQASVDDPVPTAQNNVAVTLQALELARELKPEMFIQFSTDEVYGPCEPDGTGHKEWDPIRPSNPYSASKAAQEAFAFAWWRCYGVPVVITNTMNNFGETQAPSKFPAMVQSLVSQGQKVLVHAASDGEIGTRYYLHSRNAADALLFILKNTKATMHAPGEIDQPDRYNIVGDRQMNNMALAELIASMMGKPLSAELVDFHKDQPGHDLHYGLDGTKLRELGWRSPVSFEDSLRSTIEWQQRNPEWLHQSSMAVV